jgi:predicted nucleic acid-binding protein
VSPPRVYVDTNVYISAFETGGARTDHARWLFDAAEQGRLIVVTSELTLAELLVRPIAEGATYLIDAFRAMIAPGPSSEVVPVSRRVLEGAAGLRASRRGLKLPDAIHCASALEARCSAMVTDDRRIGAIPELRVLGLSPFVVEDVLDPGGRSV